MITIIGLDRLDEPMMEKVEFELREYATRVEYRVHGAPPAWDDVPGESVIGLGRFGKLTIRRVRTDAVL